MKLPDSPTLPFFVKTLQLIAQPLKFLDFYLPDYVRWAATPRHGWAVDAPSAWETVDHLQSAYRRYYDRRDRGLAARIIPSHSGLHVSVQPWRRGITIVPSEACPMVVKTKRHVHSSWEKVISYQ
jgi:hypothetical protein